MPGGQVVGLRRHKHAVLLVLLFIVLAITTINAQSDAERLHTDVLRTVLGVAIWIVVFERRRERAMMAQSSSRPWRSAGGDTSPWRASSARYRSRTT